MIVCHCHGITDRDVRQAVAAGAKNVAGVRRACNACAGCAGCAPRVREIVEAERAKQRLSLPLLQSVAGLG